jgi:hypothetical protein
VWSEVYDIPLLGQAFIWSFETKAHFGWSAQYALVGQNTSFWVKQHGNVLWVPGMQHSIYNLGYLSCVLRSFWWCNVHVSLILLYEQPFSFQRYSAGKASSENILLFSLGVFSHNTIYFEYLCMRWSVSHPYTPRDCQTAQNWYLLSICGFATEKEGRRWNFLVIQVTCVAAEPSLGNLMKCLAYTEAR